MCAATRRWPSRSGDKNYIIFCTFMCVRYNTICSPTELCVAVLLYCVRVRHVPVRRTDDDNNNNNNNIIGNVETNEIAYVRTVASGRRSGLAGDAIIAEIFEGFCTTVGSWNFWLRVRPTTRFQARVRRIAFKKKKQKQLSTLFFLRTTVKRRRLRYCFHNPLEYSNDK